MGKFIQFSERCRCCGKTVVYNVTEDAYNAYMNGAHVQDAFPEVSPGDREVLISGLCEDCWDKIFQGY